MHKHSNSTYILQKPRCCDYITQVVHITYLCCDSLTQNPRNLYSPKVMTTTELIEHFAYGRKHLVHCAVTLATCAVCHQYYFKNYYILLVNSFLSYHALTVFVTTNINMFCALIHRQVLRTTASQNYVLHSCYGEARDRQYIISQTLLTHYVIYYTTGYQ